MTNEEAIKILAIAKFDIEWNYPWSCQEALDMAIKALEKQTPQKLRYDKETRHRFCPNCGASDTVASFLRYCDCCGQALDIGDV